MTREEWKDRLPLIQGFVEGKDVYHHHNGCHLETSPVFDDSVIKYRLVDHPQAPKIVPWTILTCPLSGVVRRKGENQHAVIQARNDEELCIPSRGWVSYDAMLDCFEHLKPDGTWGPCGIEVTPLQKAPDIT